MTFRTNWKTVCLGMLLTALCGGLALAESPRSAGGELGREQLRELRRRMAHRPRRIIFNNDGCDCLYFPKDEEVTIENFLAKRTRDLAGTQVDTIAYCTISSGFGNFTHRTETGSVLTRSASETGFQPEMRNIAQDLIDQGTDCLQAVLDFAHRHEMELFWSMRMNDTHDVAHTPERPYFLFPQLKNDHPDWLVGDHLKRTPYGRWSSVDYARPEVRNLAFRFIEEVCRNYDVDGIELDFFRHLCYYRIETQGRDLKVFVDDQLRLEAAGTYGPSSAGGRNELAFGAADSTNEGEACWEFVRARTGSQACQDLVVKVAYP